ncbi:MAG: hypothetical protein M5R40_15515 [Anaerolineae bacterium]|nr:hypothetical protein [Anaerolineae bacterium]
MSLRRRGRARRRYNARQTRSGAFRSLIGWFILGMFSALIFVVIMTPLTIRYIMPVTWLDRLPPVLKCMHPSFCRDELLPTVAAPVDVESLFEVAPPGEVAGGGEAAGGEGDNPGAGVAMAAEVTDTPAWTVSTTEPTPTLMPTATPDEAPAGLGHAHGERARLQRGHAHRGDPAHADARADGYSRRRGGGGPGRGPGPAGVAPDRLQAHHTVVEQLRPRHAHDGPQLLGMGRLAGGRGAVAQARRQR